MAFPRGLRLGGTGRFPEGKLHRTDEGELRMVVFVRQGKVVVDFGKPVAWLGLDAEKARELAQLLMSKADEAVS